MKILVHTIFYKPELVGVAKYTAEMCEWLAARGHQVEVVCPPPYYPKWRVEPPHRQWRYRKEILEGVRVTRCPIWLPKRPGGLQRILYAISFLIASLPVVARALLRRPDIIFVIEPSFLNAIPALIGARFTGALAWLEIKDFEIDLAFELGQFRRPWFKSLLLGFESWVMRGFDVVSTISRPMQDRVLAKGVDPARSHFFPDWVNTDVIFPMATASPLRVELGIPDSATVALFSGTLNAKCGVEVVIAAARRLSDSGNVPNILFVVCGDGPAASSLRSMAAGLANIRFIPLQPPERLNELLNIADLHLLPQVAGVGGSVLPSKLLGMLSSGRAIAATVDRESEVGRFVDSCGVSVPPGDDRALAEAICRLASDSGERARLGQEARDQAVRSLRHDLILGQFEQEAASRLGILPETPDTPSTPARIRARSASAR